ncbi:polysaccharide biosynthesis tyrosine autokinase [Sodalis sp. RH24]|uniref:polysaccharide biosynthesis tyrosine autokinase n=1 Tax=unclassified Sodalis (in: enterobacteria) TaxID=2636512 RepID=UPI0039B5E091
MINKNKLPFQQDNNDEIDIGRIFGTLIDNKWIILSITLIFTVLAIIYAILATPIYRADSLIQVEKTPQSAVLESLNPATEPASSTEIELIKSRMVIGKTVTELNFDTIVTRKYLPIIGEALARLTKNNDETVSISLFSVPDKMVNIPYNLKIIDETKFEILTDDNKVLLQGSKGETYNNNGITIRVANINAKPGAEFTLTKIPFLAAYNLILSSFDVADKGKDTGILSLTYDDADPYKASTILENISENYLIQNVNRKTEEAGKSLDFIKQQLPTVQSTLNQSEDTLNNFRSKNNSVDLSLEAKSLLDTIVQLDAQLNELTFKESDISKLYTKDHPSYKALLEKRKVLEQEKAALTKRVSGLPDTQQQILRLTREVKVGQEVYMQLLNRQQQLDIAKASTVGNVRIIDNALTRLSPIAPKKALILLLGFFAGLVIAIASTLLHKALHKGINGPEELESNGINVYATIPISNWQLEHDRNSKLRGKDSISQNILALGNPTDIALESIRSLRTSLNFAMIEAKNKILMITGVSPSIGKSFICGNLAIVLAQAGQKVLLIDGDLRKGYLHEVLKNHAEKTSANKGLSSILLGRENPENMLEKIDEVENLDFIGRGQIPPNPSELLMRKQFSDFLEWANENYDIVIIDTPPILAVTDAAIIGGLCGTSLLVTRFEENTIKQVETSIRRFENNGIDIKGVILNAIVRRASNHYAGDGYGYYQYDYGSKDKK